MVRRGAYLIPSLFTIANMALGFYAVVLALRADFQLGILLIFLAAFLDGLDGRIARVTMTESEFGKEYDSLADLITFGMAPAIVVYVWGLSELGRVGWLLPFFYLVCAATRLARFNVHSGRRDRRFFVGLPAPAAAGGLGSILYFANADPLGQATQGPEWLQASRIVLLFGCVAFGMLMMSTFRYYSFKEIDPRRRWSFRIAVPILLAFLLVALNPPGFFLLVSGSYALSGPFLWLRSRGRTGTAGAALSDPSVSDSDA